MPKKLGRRRGASTSPDWMSAKRPDISSLHLYQSFVFGLLVSTFTEHLRLCLDNHWNGHVHNTFACFFFLISSGAGRAQRIYLSFSWPPSLRGPRARPPRPRYVLQVHTTPQTPCQTPPSTHICTDVIEFGQLSTNNRTEEAPTLPWHQFPLSATREPAGTVPIASHQDRWSTRSQRRCPRSVCPTPYNDRT